MKNLKSLSFVACFFFMLVGQVSLQAQDKVAVSSKDIVGKYVMDGKKLIAEVEKKMGFLADEQKEGILSNIKNQYLYIKADNKLEVSDAEGSVKTGTWKLDKGEFVTKVSTEKRSPIVAFEKGKHLVLEMPNDQLGSIKITWKPE
ncbi:MAG TPA: hypothetical protein DCS93_26075 [Microscillaceae bacterium]|nr:hypothetical protein [Microscillaceae bacterium]